MDMKQVDDTRKTRLKDYNTRSGFKLKWGTQTFISEKQNSSGENNIVSV